MQQITYSLITQNVIITYYTTNYNTDFNSVKAFCESKGIYIATFEDLQAAYYDGYQTLSCGYDYASIGIIPCSMESNQGVFCRHPMPVFLSKNLREFYYCFQSSEYGTEPYMHPSPVETSFALSGRRFATPSQKGMFSLKAAYYDGNEKHSCGWTANGISYLVMQDSTDYVSIGVIPCSLESKRKFLQTPDTSLATFEDLAQAYGLGYETCSCGWTDNGFAYLVMQTPTQKYFTSVGAIKCSWQNTWNAFCKPSSILINNRKRLVLLVIKQHFH
ncbi:hypothetical protein ACJMK2_016644 [Sinanodonta woodiana]|uniref:Link domain-containing protein n=1 Tax=Sinanodonta woodiana TaxID=1069815 RepID=A0ABD3UUB3_SINWO